ncbi:hypothetical protein O7627_27340 [Solwaraspora sp. WMMD1047]|uniref:hypothetical protein n=1 Tax=Solwaraspora sp. WMMD1047 TaxID=3016102 RepID=UPI002417B6D1|nr:hypothetical protein [Solwaraspora sp. WMMD1047]MDG4832991.1 hypothetical protein [Solwaraspora sp. WMMD1047]
MNARATYGLHDPSLRDQLAARLHRLRPLTDPYLAVTTARLAHVGATTGRQPTKLPEALRVLTADRMLHEPTGRRVPLTETPARLIEPLQRAYRLEPADVDALRFSINLTYEYPGIVGSPTAPLALKARPDPGYRPAMTADEILRSQQDAGPDGLNTSYLVSQMKGGMSVDFGIGCPLMCAYCYRREGDTVDGYLGSWQPTEFLDADQAIDRLLAHPWFTPHITPIGLHMSTSEAFIPQLWPRTLAALRRLDDLGLTNRVSCITKYGLSDEQITALEELRNVDLDINVCYAAMPSTVEPPNVAKRIDFLRRALRSERLNVIAYYRPIAEGINTTDTHIRTVWETFKTAGARVVVLGGLKFGDDHLTSFMTYGLPLPAGTFTPGKKLLTPDTERRIMTIYDQVYADIEPERRPVVVRRSSCGRVIVRGSHQPDYNGHYDTPQSNCLLRCPLDQHAVCAAATPPTKEQVRHLLARIPKPDAAFSITGHTVVVHPELTPFERTFLRQNLVFPVHTAREAAVGIVKALS